MRLVGFVAFGKRLLTQQREQERCEAALALTFSPEYERFLDRFGLEKECAREESASGRLTHKEDL